MIKKIVLFLSVAICLYGQDYNLNLDKDSVALSLSVSATDFISEKLDNNSYSIVLRGKFEINESMWGYPVNKIESKFDGKNSILTFYFENTPFKPEIKQENSKLHIIFYNKTAAADNSTSPYLRMFLGIVVILILILIMYWLLKFFMKKNITSDIPGIGRLIGKVDIMPGKSIAFFELLNTIYLLSITSESITLIDKIEDETICDRIKEGFVRKKDFSSYLRFFGKEIDREELKITEDILKEKVEKLKRK